MRHFTPDKNQAEWEEVQKRLNVGYNKECYYPDWLTNIVMEKKPSGSWRICVDYAYINKACLKDCFPFPKINQLEDSISYHGYLTFMDTYADFHQIPMWERY